MQGHAGGMQTFFPRSLRKYVLVCWRRVDLRKEEALPDRFPLWGFKVRFQVLHSLQRIFASNYADSGHELKRFVNTLGLPRGDTGAEDT